jgi:signal transduction histidine kinase
VLSAERRTWPWWAEALLVTGVGLTTVQESYISAGGVYLRPTVAGAAVASVALLLRYRWPLLVTAVAVAAAAVLGSLLPLLVMLFYLATRGSVVVAVLCWCAAMVGNLAFQPEHSLWGTRSYGPVALLTLAIVLGLWVRSRRRLAESLAEQARLGERARIAAEMHDMLAHRLSVLALHAGALRQRSAGLPPAVAERIDLLRSTATEALRDLRGVLGALHEVDVYSVRDLPVLLDEARAGGQVVEADIDGAAQDTPVTHRLAVQRVVQEALTNARKHAAGAPVRITVHYGPPVSTVEVRNEAGTPDAGVPSGYGLVGLAERVGPLGGTLEYGPVGSGGWRLAATIPVTDGPGPA